MSDRTDRRDRARSAKKWGDLLSSEREAAALYDMLAASQTGEPAEILRELASVERRHAAHWESLLLEAGLAVPPPGRVGARTRLITATAQRVSLDAVLPLIERAERGGAGVYDADPDAAPGMAEDERGHAVVLASLRSGNSGPAGTVAARTRSAGTGVQGGGSAQQNQIPAQSRIAQRERWHRSDRSGALRAGIFGVSDGLVSNTALVMGFAGSGASRPAVLLAGVAGLLAGAFSMAAGEYVSMSGQREMFEREISIEATELEEKPEEEREELVLLYRAKGLATGQARELAEKIMSDRTVALDTLVREELGLDPDALGSPWAAAFSSVLTFAAGAFVVVLPYLFGGGNAAFVTAVVLSVLAMAAVGIGIGLLNGRSVVRSAVRQVLAGALAAGVTYGVGDLIGTQMG